MTPSRSKACRNRGCDLPARVNALCDLHHQLLVRRTRQAQRDVGAAAKVRGRAPSMAWYRDNAPARGWTPVSTLVSWFGTWNGVMAAAGQRVRPYRRTQSDVTAALRAAVRKSRGNPTEEWYRQQSADQGWPSVQTVLRHFGTWNQSLVEVGVARIPRKFWSTKEIRAALVEAAELLGRDFTQAEYAASASAHGWPSVPTIRNRYVQWSRAIAAARRAR